MDRAYFSRRGRTLGVLLVLASAYILCVTWRGTITGSWRLDGHLGVLLGLFICAHPSAHAVDLLFYHRQTLHDLASQWFGVVWFGLNLLTLAVGWFVIVQGIGFVTARG